MTFLKQSPKKDCVRDGNDVTAIEIKELSNAEKNVLLEADAMLDMGLTLPDVSRTTSLTKMLCENCATPRLADCEHEG